MVALRFETPGAVPNVHVAGFGAGICRGPGTVLPRWAVLVAHHESYPKVLLTSVRPLGPWFAHRAHPYVPWSMAAKCRGLRPLSRLQVTLGQTETECLSLQILNLFCQLTTGSTENFKEITRLAHGTYGWHALVQFILILRASDKNLFRSWLDSLWQNLSIPPACKTQLRSSGGESFNCPRKCSMDRRTPRPVEGSACPSSPARWEQMDKDLMESILQVARSLLKLVQALVHCLVFRPRHLGLHDGPMVGHGFGLGSWHLGFLTAIVLAIFNLMKRIILRCSRLWLCS